MHGMRKMKKKKSVRHSSPVKHQQGYLFAMLRLRQPPDQLKFHHVMQLLLLVCILKFFRAHSRECFFCFAPISFSLHSLRTYTLRLHFMPTSIHALRHFSSWNILNHGSLCDVCNHGTLSIANEFADAIVGSYFHWVYYLHYFTDIAAVAIIHNFNNSHNKNQ